MKQMTVVNALVEEWVERNTSRDLSDLEREEAFNIANGFTIKESATAMNNSPETIRGRRKNLYRKLQVNDSRDFAAELLKFALLKLESKELNCATSGAVR